MPAFKSLAERMDVVVACCVSFTKIFKVTVAVLEVPTQVAGGKTVSLAIVGAEPPARVIVTVLIQVAPFIVSLDSELLFTEYLSR